MQGSRSTVLHHGAAILIATALAGPRLSAQCVPPAGTYTITAGLPAGASDPCPGAPVTVEIVGATGGGGAIQGFGFNVQVSGPATITGVAAGFTTTGGGAFLGNFSATQACALGVAPAASPILGLLATITITPTASDPDITIAFTGTLALPTGIVPANHLVVAGCDVVTPTLTLGAAVLVCPEFLRGDCNNNGLIAGYVGDIAFILHTLFTGMAGPMACRDACDANDDGAFNIADALYLINWMFMVPAGPVPPAPFGPFPAGCGGDTTPDALDCAASICP